MKRSPFLLVVLVGFILSSFKPMLAPLPIGASIPNPDLKMKDVSGKEISFNEVMGEKGLLVMFSCNTCPFVIKHQQKTKEVAKHALSNNIGVILLNSNEGNRDDNDSFEAMKAYAKEQGYDWRYAVDKDSKMANEFGATMTPECFLFNKDGKLVYHGAINNKPRDPNNGDKEYLKLAIDEIVAGKNVTQQTYPQYGCSIKRRGN
ncbi:MAG: thioredoxin family protein [Sphingobacteriales bacterium]|nr:thioredoxin family protein [Sphingobacteriales bacterium]